MTSRFENNFRKLSKYISKHEQTISTNHLFIMCQTHDKKLFFKNNFQGWVVGWLVSQRNFYVLTQLRTISKVCKDQESSLRAISKCSVNFVRDQNIY